MDIPAENVWADATPARTTPDQTFDPAEILKKDKIDLAPSVSTPTSDYYHEYSSTEPSHISERVSGTRQSDLDLEPLPHHDGDRAFADFEVPPPVLLSDAELALRGYIWLPCSKGEIPRNAVLAGVSERRGLFGSVTKEPLYVARAKHGVALVPGKASAFLSGCNYSLGDGKERLATSYQVCSGGGNVFRSSSLFLCFDQVLTHPEHPTHDWRPLTAPSRALRNLVGSAFRTTGGDNLAVARAEHHDGVHLGWVSVVEVGQEVKLGSVRLPWGGGEVVSSIGEVLVIE